MRSLVWDYQKKVLRIIDQRVLPAYVQHLELKNTAQVTKAIKNMAIRGAPAIGVAAAYGLAMAGLNSTASSMSEFKEELQVAVTKLQRSRPTAVNLTWALQRMRAVIEKSSGSVAELQQAIEDEADQIDRENVADCLTIATFGAGLIDDGDTIIHHCNTGPLAVVAWGTALGMIMLAHAQGKHVHVLVDETRPRLQGTRLTAWELQRHGVPFEIICDNAAGHYLHRGKVNKVIFGADRVVRNGDLANKVGTYMLAMAAYSNHVPVFSAFPSSSVDLSLEDGSQIEIEERGQDEVLDIQLHGERVTPEGARALNPAFDITPHEYISAFITELGVIRPPFEENLEKIIKNHRR